MIKKILSKKFCDFFGKHWFQKFGAKKCFVPKFLLLNDLEVKIIFVKNMLLVPNMGFMKFSDLSRIFLVKKNWPVINWGNK